MKKRILVSIPIVAVVLLAVFAQNWFLALFAVFIGVGAQIEVVRALCGRITTDVGIISIATSWIWAGLFLMDFARSSDDSVAFLTPLSSLCILLVGTILIFGVSMIRHPRELNVWASAIVTLVYPELFSGSLYVLVLYLRHVVMPGGFAYVLTVTALAMLFVPPMLSDTLAYFWGSRFGRTKLCPAISPHKTVAGSVAGLAGGAAGAGLVYLLLDKAGKYAHVHFQPGGNIGTFIALGALLAFLSQFGDLVASNIKRSVGVKDFGNLLPGHGGIMDRVDSTLFTAPFVYIFVIASCISVQVS